MKPRNTILVVDDEADILEFIRYNLEKEGYEVLVAGTGRDALERLKETEVKMIILDIMMPGKDGVETCRTIRTNPVYDDVFIIFLTARSEEYSEVAAFEAGANDYITKPLKPRALISRINAYFKRENFTVSSNQSISIKGLTIDRESYTVFKDNIKIYLAKKEFELLYFFCQHPNKIFNRDELLKKVWGPDVYVVNRTVDVHIRKIREKIGEDYIKTIKGIGYKLDSSRV